MKPRRRRTRAVFDHILLATDFSDTSERAIELAAGLARALRARVTVVHVVEMSEAASPATALATERTWPRATRARAEIDRTVDRLRARGVKTEGLLRFGLLPERIFEVGREIGADLIVTGTRPRKGFARLWYRSIAEELLRDSPIPVLAAAARAREETSSEPENVVQLRRR
jgi:nucleotide-binding universal stress UspA family protein